jgi:hypothetical protein
MGRRVDLPQVPPRPRAPDAGKNLFSARPILRPTKNSQCACRYAGKSQIAVLWVCERHGRCETPPAIYVHNELVASQPTA